MNVKFNYLYRDAGNYKSWGSTVFKNPDELTTSEIGDRLHKAFFQNVLFIAAQIGVPDVFLYEEGDATEDDVCFHEFDSVECAEDASTDPMDRTIVEFLEAVESSSGMGWKSFDPLFPKH